MSAFDRTALTLRTADGEELAALHMPAATPTTKGPTTKGPTTYGPATAVVLVPGFSGWSERPAVRLLAAELHRCAPSLGLLLVDLRGHGHSSGRTTLGDREVFDVDAAVLTARDLGYERVLTMGWSMGATCVLRHSALQGDEVHGHRLSCPADAVVTVSAVSRWDVRDTRAMRRLHHLVETRLGRAIARRLLSVRIDPAGWSAPPLSPTGAAARLGVPLLVVHGAKDHYFGWEHGRELADAAGPRATLWLVPGLGHAEDAAVRPDVPGLIDRLGAALEAMAAGLAAPEWGGPTELRSVS